MEPNIQLVGNLWGYIIYWVFGDFIDLFTYFPANSLIGGFGEYFEASIGSPMVAVYVLVGTFIDLRLISLVALFILVQTPQRWALMFTVRILRALDRLPLPFIG